MLVQLGPAGLGRSEGAATSTPPSPPSTWSGDTSAVQLPALFQGQEFLGIFDELARAQPRPGPSETPEQFRMRVAAWPVPQSWFVFRIDERLSLAYERDSQVGSCRIDLKSDPTGDPASAGATVLILHADIRPRASYSAYGGGGLTRRITPGDRDVQGLLLVTKDGELARPPMTFDCRFPLKRAPGAMGSLRLRGFAVCRVTPLSADYRVALDQESYTEPTAGLPVRLHNRFRYLCAHLVSIWFEDTTTGAIVHKERFDPSD